ncbi:MAG: cobalamin-binding protein [Chloroflexota bacterium]
MRIVSLLASATEIVASLGLQESLVGVSADSDWPLDAIAGRPILNTIAFDPNAMSSREIDAAASAGHQGASLYHVDADLLRDLHPDLILTQEVCDVCSVSRRDLELATRMIGYTPKIISLNAVDLDGVLADIAQVADLAHANRTGTAAVALLRRRVDAVRQATYGAPRKRVMCLEWLDPPYSAGHWIPEMVDIAGGQDDMGTPSGPSREVEWSDVVADAPEVVVLMPCSLSLERVASEFAELRRMPGWDDIPAVRTGQVFAGHTDLFARSGPRLVDGVEALARMLHPERVARRLDDGLALKVSTDGQRLEPYY